MEKTNTVGILGARVTRIGFLGKIAPDLYEEFKGTMVLIVQHTITPCVILKVFPTSDSSF